MSFYFFQLEKKFTAFFLKILHILKIVEVIIGSMDVNVNVHPTTSATGFGNEDNITNEILKQAFGTDTFDNTMGGQPEPQNWRRLINPRDFVACPICTEVITWMMFTSHVDKHEKEWFLTTI